MAPARERIPANAGTSALSAPPRGGALSFDPGQATRRNTAMLPVSLRFRKGAIEKLDAGACTFDLHVFAEPP
jgi:hypothetical protein